MSQADHDSSPRVAPPGLGELLTTVQAQTTRLVRAEMTLARLEMQAKGKEVALGAGMFGVAAIAGFLATAAFVTAAILGLALVLDPWLAALIVGGILAIVAGFGALLGLSSVVQASPLLPAQTRSSVAEDLKVVSSAVGHE